MHPDSSGAVRAGEKVLIAQSELIYGKQGELITKVKLNRKNFEKSVGLSVQVGRVMSPVVLGPYGFGVRLVGTKVDLQLSLGRETEHKLLAGQKYKVIHRDVLVLPLAALVPKRVSTYARRHKLLVVRTTRQGFGICCGVCLGAILHETETTELADFYYYTGLPTQEAWNTGKPEITGGGAGLLCDRCGRWYALPNEEIEYYS